MSPNEEYCNPPKRRKLSHAEEFIQRLEVLRTDTEKRELRQVQKIVPLINELMENSYLNGLERVVDDLPPRFRRRLFSADPLRQVIHWAYNMRSKTLFEFLLQKRWVSLQERNCMGRTVLDRAVRDNEIYYVRLLLKYRAHIRAVDCVGEGECPPVLKAAILFSSVEVVKLLVEAGLNTHLHPDLGDNALFVAASIQNWPCIEYFLSLRSSTQFCQYSQDCIDAFHSAMSRGCVTAFTLLWPYQPDTCPSRMALFVEALFQHSQEDIADEIMKQSPDAEKILQLEIKGVFNVSRGFTDMALEAWTIAKIQRLEKENYSSVLTERNPHSVACLLDTEEVQTVEELTKMKRTLENMHVQSLLIVERILPASRLYFRFLRLVANDAWENQEYTKFVALVKRAADDGQDLPDHRKLIDDMIFIQSQCACEQEFEFFTHEALLAHMQALTSLISHRQVCDGRNKAENPLREHHEKTCNTCILYANVDIYFIMTLNQFFDLGEPSEEDVSQLRETLTSYVQLRQKLQTFSPFLPMVEQGCFRLRSVEALVQVSASVNKTCQKSECPLHLLPGSQGETPLHYFARCMSKDELVGEKGLISLFVQNGADLCSQDLHGTNIIDILNERGIVDPTQGFLSLQCLAARVVHRCRGETVRNDATIPKRLQNFILQH